LPNDGRLRYTNYGKGVLLWQTDAQAACFVNAQHVTSTDLYWFTDPNDGPPNRFGSKYGDNVRRQRHLDRMDGLITPQWAFVETGWPFTEGPDRTRAIQPAELRSAVWHSIIAGARGIIYFQHSFGGPHAGDHMTLRTNSEGTRDIATQVNAQIRTLAPVLNSPSVTSGHSSTDTMDGTARYTVKWSGSKLYVLAGADRGGGNVTFSMPCVGNATATVEGEGRSVPVVNGSFTDSFADKNAVHVYRIDGGSTCGLR
jgi:hypothetical protein